MSDRKLAWTAGGWEDYLYRQSQDRRTLKRINLLIEDILRDDPFEGVGRRSRSSTRWLERGHDASTKRIDWCTSSMKPT